MKIYDCFIFFKEFELLELRLKTLNEVVDYFVIAEINITHSGLPKPYYFEENRERFKEYEDKIIYLKDIAYPQTNPWIVENAHRNMLQRGWENVTQDDYIMISDLDEIPNPKAILNGINLHLNIFSLVQDLYCFYVNCKSNQEWIGTVVAKWDKIVSPQDIRNNRHCNKFIYNGGWHYTSMGGKERIKEKFAAFAETDFNIPQFMNDENLDQCLETGKDLTDRKEAYAQKRFIKDSEITHKEIFEFKDKYPTFYK